MNTLLKRYWLILNPENPYGPKNIGVTAYSKEEARLLVTDMLTASHREDQLAILNNDNTKIIEDIDIRGLDQNHVVPNIGVVIFKGVWFPRCNT